jgi:hypothetical protein
MNSQTLIIKAHRRRCCHEMEEYDILQQLWSKRKELDLYEIQDIKCACTFSHLPNRPTATVLLCRAAILQVSRNPDPESAGKQTSACDRSKLMPARPNRNLKNAAACRSKRLPVTKRRTCAIFGSSRIWCALFIPQGSECRTTWMIEDWNLHWQRMSSFWQHHNASSRSGQNIAWLGQWDMEKGENYKPCCHVLFIPLRNICDLAQKRNICDAIYHACECS